MITRPVTSVVGGIRPRSRFSQSSPGSRLPRRPADRRFPPSRRNSSGQIRYWKPGTTVLEAQSWVQFARPDSLDLVRIAPRAARVQGSKPPSSRPARVAVARHGAVIYRVRVPVGSVIACSYDVDLQGGPEWRHVVGADYVCVARRSPAGPAATRKTVRLGDYIAGERFE